MPLQKILVWSWSIDDDSGSSELDEALLSESEKARAKSFLHRRSQHSYVASRIGLRTILGAHLGVAPQQLVFTENEFGKPRLLHDREVHFSLSHSAGQAVLAVSEAGAVGVDLEQVREIDHSDLARRYFHAGETAHIESLPAEAQLLAFFQTSTLKEAVVKAVGRGLSIPLDEFEITLTTSPPRLIVSPSASPPATGWGLRLLTPIEGYVWRNLARRTSRDTLLVSCLPIAFRMMSSGWMKCRGHQPEK